MKNNTTIRFLLLVAPRTMMPLLMCSVSFHSCWLGGLLLVFVLLLLLLLLLLMLLLLLLPPWTGHPESDLRYAIKPKTITQQQKE